MDELEDCQLNIESLRRQFQARVDLFGNDQDSKSLLDQLQYNEQNLRCILREYERGFLQRRCMCITDSIAINGPLLDFIEKRSEQDSEEGEQKPMALGRKLILKLIEGRSSK